MDTIGKSIREYRKKKSMTLKQLAEKADISVSFLSELERGVSNLSMASLKKIAQALDISLLSFRESGEAIGDSNNEVLEFKSREISAENKYVTDVKIVRSQQRVKIEFPGYAAVSELLTPDFNRHMEALYIKLEPGFDSGLDPIIDPQGEKFLFMLEGSADIKINNETYALNKGDTIYYPANAPLQFKNTSSITAEVIIVITPPSL
jgi:transcriptional regulator with XRE-family HTH domain